MTKHGGLRPATAVRNEIKARNKRLAMDRFAEALAECGNVAEAAFRSDTHPGTAKTYLRDMRAALGPQAV